MAGFTEFCCKPGGSNLNPGTRNGAATEPDVASDYTYTGTWTQGSQTLGVLGGGANPVADGVNLNDIAAITTSGGTFWSFLGRVSNVTPTQITIDANKCTSASPVSGSNYILKIGGAMVGPLSGANSGWPLNQSLGKVTNSTNDPVRLNIKNTQIYGTSNAISVPSDGAQNIHGYNTTYGDGGKATINGPTTGAGIVLFAPSSSFSWTDSLIFKNNGATGAAAGFSTNGAAIITRCSMQGMTGPGISAGNIMHLDECEIYNCNVFVGSDGAIHLGSGYTCSISNTIIHGNLAYGINITNGGMVLTNTILDSNSSYGINALGSSPIFIEGGEFYNNGASGINYVNTSTSRFIIRNSNFVKNGGWGIGGTQFIGAILSCGFGSGGMVNASGAIQSAQVIQSGTVTYSPGTHPWSNPGNGDFRITLIDAKGTGRGLFTHVVAGYGGTVGYPDIGAAQHQDSGGSGGGPVNFAF